MADLYSFNVDTGEVFVRALPGENLSGWEIVEYTQSGNRAAPDNTFNVVMTEPYSTDPDDGFIYYRQDFGSLGSTSGQRSALALVDDQGDLVEEVGWGKDSNFDLNGGPAGGITINPGNTNYAPGSGPDFVNGPPWASGPSPTDPGGFDTPAPALFRAGHADHDA